MTPGYLWHNLDSPSSQQHNAYTFFAGPWNRAFLGGNPQKKRGAHVERLKGTVKWFNNAKGYGFLGRDDGPDVFIHYSSITTEGYKSLQEGDKGEFEIVQGQKGAKAAKGTKVTCGGDAFCRAGFSDRAVISSAPAPVVSSGIGRETCRTSCYVLEQLTRAVSISCS